MDQKQFTDHEVRLRILEELSKQTNIKLNAILGLAISGFLVPVIMKYLGI